MTVSIGRRRGDLILGLLICLLTRSSGDQIYRGTQQGTHFSGSPWKRSLEATGSGRGGGVAVLSNSVVKPDGQWRGNNIMSQPARLGKSPENRLYLSPPSPSRTDCITVHGSDRRFPEKTWKRLDQIPDQSDSSTGGHDVWKRLREKNWRVQNGLKLAEHPHNRKLERERESQDRDESEDESLVISALNCDDISGMRELKRGGGEEDGTSIPVDTTGKECQHRNKARAEALSTQSHGNQLELAEDPSNGHHAEDKLSTGTGMPHGSIGEGSYIHKYPRQNLIGSDEKRRIGRDVSKYSTVEQRSPIIIKPPSVKLPPRFSSSEIFPRGLSNPPRRSGAGRQQQRLNRKFFQVPGERGSRDSTSQTDESSVEECAGTQSCGGGRDDTAKNRRHRRSLSTSSEAFAKTLPSMLDEADDDDDGKDGLYLSRDREESSKRDGDKWLWMPDRLSSLQRLIDQQIYGTSAPQNDRRISTYGKRKAGGASPRTSQLISGQEGWLRGVREGGRGVRRRSGGVSMSRITEMLNNYKTKGNKALPPLETLRFG